MTADHPHLQTLRFHFESIHLITKLIFDLKKHHYIWVLYTLDIYVLSNDTIKIQSHCRHQNCCDNLFYIHLFVLTNHDRRCHPVLPCPISDYARFLSAEADCFWHINTHCIEDLLSQEPKCSKFEDAIEENIYGDHIYVFLRSQIWVGATLILDICKKFWSRIVFMTLRGI